MDIAKFKNQFAASGKGDEFNQALESLTKAQECLERISDIETKMMNVDLKDSDIEVEDSEIVTNSIMDKLKEPEEILSTEVGKYISIYGIKYMVVSNYPKMFKVKKMEHKRHVVPIRSGHKIKLLGKHYSVVKAEPQHITFKK